MLAACFSEYGGPGVLQLRTVADPVAAADDVLIRVRAAAVNRLDLDLRSGRSRLPLALPHILGMEAAGEVVSCPEGCGLDVGTRVIVLSSRPCGACGRCLAGLELHCPERKLLGVHLVGGYAEYVCAPARSVIALPPAVSFEAGAALQTSLGAAWRALKVRAALAAGETVLVNGSGGGVGTAAVQVGRALGATVIASAGSAAKLDRARELGADHTIDYLRESLVERVLEITGGRGVDAVLESVGGEVLDQSLRALAPMGRVVTVGAHGGEVVPVDVIDLFRQERTLIGSVGATHRELEEVVDLVGRGVLAPTIDSVIPLADAAEAHHRLESRKCIGKLVLVP